MKKLLLALLLFITVNTYGQQPTPLMNAYIPGITATQIIDNRPAQTRQLTYVSIACSGTGTWQAALSYSSSSSGSWTSYGASGIVDQSSTTPIAYGFKLVYPNYIRVLITGTATCNFSGFQNLYPGSTTSGGTGTMTSVTVAGTASQITATGTCSATDIVTCTFSIPSAFVLPGTINGLTLTTSSGTFTLTNSKTFTVLKSLTLEGTDGVTVTFPSSNATVATLGLTNTFTGRQDATGAASTAPAKTGTSLPATCTVGDQYFKSDATNTAVLYACATTNTWTQQTGTGGGGGGDVVGPASATDNCAPLYDGTTGKLIKNSNVCFDPAYNGGFYSQGVTSGGLAFSVANIAGTATTLIWPTDSATATTGYAIILGAVATCPTLLDPGAPSTCRFLTYGAVGGGGGGAAVDPYSTTVSSQTSVSISAATHLQGVLAVPTCYDSATPRRAVACDFTRNTSGDLVFTFSPAFTGQIQIGSGGGTSGSVYSAAQTSQTSVSITAATHGKGTTPRADCFNNSSPALIVACSYTRNGSGDLVFTFSPAFTGTIEIRY